MKQAKYTVNGDNHLVDQGGNHFVNGKCINPKDGEGEIGDTHNIPEGATQSGAIKTGRITSPIQFVDEFKRVVTINP